MQIMKTFTNIKQKRYDGKFVSVSLIFIFTMDWIFCIDLLSNYYFQWKFPFWENIQQGSLHCFKHNF